MKQICCEKIVCDIKQQYFLGEDVFFIRSFVAHPYVLEGKIIGVQYLVTDRQIKSLGIHDEDIPRYPRGVYFTIQYIQSGLLVSCEFYQEEISLNPNTLYGKIKQKAESEHEKQVNLMRRDKENLLRENNNE